MAMMDDDKDINRGPDLNAEIGRRRGKKRVCKYCTDKALVIDYKDPQALKYFISERGKITPRRIRLKVCRSFTPRSGPSQKYSSMKLYM